MKGSLWEYYKEIGNQYFREKKYEEALINYKKAIEVNDQIEVLYSNKGTCEKCLKNYRQALIDYKKAVSLNPMNAKNLHRTASVLLILGILNEALETQKKSILLAPFEYTYKDQLVIIEELIEEDKKMLNYFDNNETQKLEERIDFLIKKYPDFIYLKKMKCQIIIDGLRYDEAIKYITNEIMENKIRDKDFAYYLILVFYLDGRYSEAEELINIAEREKLYDERYKDLLYKIKNIDSLKQKANDLYFHNKYEEAIKEYTNLLSFDQRNKKFISIILANRASCYQKLNKNYDALLDLNKCLKINPKYTKGYIKRGNVLLQLKKYKEAIEDFMKAKEIEPNSTNGIEDYFEKTNKKITDLENELNNEKIRNEKLYKEIISLKNIINNKDFLINDQTDKIDDLRKSIQNFDNVKYTNKDKLLELMEKLEAKEEQLKKVENELNQTKLRNPFDLKEGERLMTVIFVSGDQKIHHSFICKNTDKFNKLENMLYEIYPNYIDSENYFIVNGEKINKYKSLDFNNIKDSDVITLYQVDFNNESFFNDISQKEYPKENINQNTNFFFNEKILK